MNSGDPLAPNVFFETEVLWNFKTKCVYLDYFDSISFEKCISQIIFYPIVTFNFLELQNSNFLCLRTNNYSILINLTNSIKHSENIFNRLSLSILVPCNSYDLKCFQEIIDKEGEIDMDMNQPLFNIGKFRAFAYKSLKNNKSQNKFTGILRNYLESSFHSFHIDTSHIVNYENNVQILKHCFEYQLNSEFDINHLSISAFINFTSISSFTYYIAINYYSLFHSYNIKRQYDCIDSLKMDDLITINSFNLESKITISRVIRKDDGCLLSLIHYSEINDFEIEKEYFRNLFSDKEMKAFPEKRILIFPCYVVGTLKDIIQSKKKNIILNDNIKTKIIINILKEIDCFHSHGIAHSNIKSSNILITSDFNVIIHGYNQNKNKQNPDFEYDLYSFGIIIHEISTGIATDNLENIISKIKNGEIPKLPEKIGKISRIYRMVTSLSHEARIISFYLLNEMIEKKCYFDNCDIDFSMELRTSNASNNRKDIELIKERATKNYLFQFYMGLIFLRGVCNIKQDQHKGIEYLQKSAQQGCVDAQYFLASCYLNKISSENENKKGIDLLKKAADKNYSLALYDLAIVKLNSANEKAECVDYLINAAIQKHPEAASKLGIFYLKGQFVSPDKEMAIKLLKIAAEQYDSIAQTKLALLNLNVNNNECLYYLEKAAKEGNPEALYNLGLLYYQKDHSVPFTLVPKDVNYSIELFTKASNMGDINSQAILGEYYFVNSASDESSLNKAIDLLNKSSQKGNDSAMYILGNYYIEQCQNQENEKKDLLNKGISLIQKASDNNNAAAQTKLGVFHFKGGFGMEINISKAIDLFKKAAAQKYAPALTYLGICYLEGRGVSVDKTRAISCFSDAADQRFPDAQNKLGVCYLNGDGVENNPNKAFKLFELASSKNYHEAQYNLGVCYFNAIGTEENKKIAINLFLKSAEQDYSNAQFNLGKCFWNGDGVDEDKKKAIFYYQKAADKGDIEAMYDLGVAYLNGFDDVEPNMNKAIFLLQKSAEKDYPPSQCMLGTCYMKGVGVEEDRKKGFELFKLAAEKFYDEGLFNLGNCYFYGDFVEQDFHHAIHLYEIAAEKENYPNAQHMLGLCYLNGKGVEVNEQKAFDLLKKAANQGFPPSLTQIGSFFFKGYGNISVDKEKAIQFFSAAAQSGYPEAQTNLAICFLTGIEGIIDQNKDNALKLFQLAAEHGEVRAQNYLNEFEALFDDLVKSTKESDKIAQFNIGLRYFRGECLPLDKEKGIELIKQSAEQGYAPAQSQLGALYFNGTEGFMEINKEKAIDLFKKAAIQEFPEAQFNLANIYLRGDENNEMDKEKAANLFEKAAKQGHIRAKTSLGVCLIAGDGIAADRKRAISLFKESADSGDEEAAHLLDSLIF